MRNQPHPMFVGYFVIGVILLIFVGVIYLAQYNFSKSRRYILFFNNAVSGLRKGANVNYRGVKVGTVLDVYATLDVEDTHHKDVSIPVVIEIDTDHFKVINDKGKKYDFDEILDQYIEDGLRAQLELQSILTGLLQIQLDFYNDSVIKLSHRIFEYKEIPTVPSSLSQFTKQLQEIPVKDIALKIGNAAENISTLTQKMTISVEEINKDLPALTKEALETIERIKTTFQDIAHMSNTVATTFSQDSDIVQGFNTSLDSVDNAARAVRELSETINTEPNSLIFGRRG